MGFETGTSPLPRPSNGEFQPADLLATGGRGRQLGTRVRSRDPRRYADKGAAALRGREASCEGSDGGPAATRTWTSNVHPASLPVEQQSTGAWDTQCCRAQTLGNRAVAPPQRLRGAAPRRGPRLLR